MHRGRAGTDVLPVQARRVFRLGLTMALSLAAGYAIPLDLPYLAPLFALILTFKPAPPPGPKGLIQLIIVVLLTTGLGLLMIPLLLNYPASGVLIVAVSLYLSNYLAVNLNKGAIGTLLAMGIALISAAGTLSFVLAQTLVEGLALGIGIAVICQWLVYPFFPEDAVGSGAGAEAGGDPVSSNWIALRATLIVIPAWLFALTNPAANLPVIMKSVTLGQQSSVTNARTAGRELLGSTFLGGCFAIVFWWALGVVTNLWMFTLWMLMCGIYFACKLYGVIASRFPPSFWINALVTLLILLGPAVQDSATGKDVYKAFAVRMGMFIAVTVYAWAAIVLLEFLRTRRLQRLTLPSTDMESNS